MSVKRVVLALLCAAGVVFTTALSCGAADVAGEVLRDDPAIVRWATERYDEVANLVFGQPVSLELGSDTEWVVTARVRPAGESEPEIQLAVSKFRDGEITIAVTEMVNPLYVQLYELAKAHQGSSLREVATLVKSERVVLSSARCPKLRTPAEKFESLRPKIAVTNALMLDSRQYQLWVDGGPQQIYFNILTGSSGHSTHPVVLWIEETRRLVEHIEGAANKAECVADPLVK